MSKHRKRVDRRKAFAGARHVDARELLLEVVIEQGLKAVHGLLAESVAMLCGARHVRRDADAPRRWGKQRGELVLGGRRVRLMRPRVRQGGREAIIPAYARFQEEDPLHERALEQMLVGVSTRKYRRSLEDFPGLEESGTSKSAVSRRFVAATTVRLEALLGKPLQGIEWVAVLIDGLRFGEHVILVALGIDAQGNKHLLGLREGATENATVCKDLLADLLERGFPDDRHLLFVLDGAKALRKAVHEVFAERALVQRCQVHKQRNVTGYLPDHMRPRIAAALGQAWRAENHDLAKRQLQNLVNALAKDHPSAASSLREGLEETLTVKRLGLTGTLERTLATTNPIENLNGSIRRVTGRVKRCRNGQMALRWIASALLEAEKGFRRVRGYRDISKLVTELRAQDNAANVTKLTKAG
jgi:transposase-like protein